jgi:hypothetical protein
MDGRVVKPAWGELLTRPRMLANGRSSNYGCGLSVATRSGLTTFTHGGAVSGFIARNTFVPRTRSAVVVVINNEDGPLANALVERALQAVMPAQAATVGVTTGALRPPREDRGEVPRIDGPEPGSMAARLFASLQSGTLDRSGLGDETRPLSPRQGAAAAEALKPSGLAQGRYGAIGRRARRYGGELGPAHIRDGSAGRVDVPQPGRKSAGVSPVPTVKPAIAPSRCS